MCSRESGSLQMTALQLMRQCFAVLALATGVLGHAATIITVVDSTGAPVPNVLVIVRSLDGAGEHGRFLSNQSGIIPG